MGVARSRGSTAEMLAAAYLELVGCEVTGRNLRLGGVEVDLVAVEGGVRVVTEVKFRTRSDYGGAALAIDPVKRGRLLRAARILVAERPGTVRIDVVAIEIEEQGARVRHYRNAVTE